MSDWSSDDENRPAKPKAKAAAKPAAAKAPAAAAAAAGALGAAQPGRTLEQTYQKKTQLEHILLRPDTYVGSVEKQQAVMWVHAPAPPAAPGAAPAGPGQLEQRAIAYVPGLYKIFDEILVNAADNKVRDPTMTQVRVDIDAAAGSIRVYNDGDGIPVEVHKEEGVYVPELIFGHLLTSSNYDDTEKKTVGGRNGYGAKLANIFSTEFVIETCDGKRGRRYRQVFNKNMSVKGEPVITACKATENWTCVTFKPDLAKFGMTELEEDTAALMRKRVFDVAGTIGKNTKVFLNGERLPVRGFSDYVGLYLAGKDASQRCYERVSDRWEICVCLSEGQFQQVSFVNSINTVKGGTHANAVADAVAAKLLERVLKKNKTAAVKPFQVKSHLWVFVNALIENPAFDSQTKETLTTKASSFGSKCEISDEYMKKVLKTGVVEAVLAWAAFKQSKELKKTDGKQRGRLTGIPKLDDANEAGGRNGDKCTLILTEGDSAKALAISGLSVVGRDHYGVFPLRGKLLNVRDATHQQIMANAEISNIKQILGLQHGKEYASTKTLRYGSLMIMTDQDHDGSHIKGLLINFLHAHFPSLLKIPNFLVEFITPIIKATKSKHRQVFYTMPEFETWRAALGPAARGWTTKYYKDTNTKPFKWEGDEDGALIDMAFSKKKVEDRKRWLRAFKPGTFLDHSVAEVRYSDFVNRELILFSVADLQRSIPSVLDGLKPSQRKVLFACFKRRLRQDIKVAQLSGYVSEHSAYHHGEASLASTIVGLAQDFVGANNVNLLVPSGQFGTRLQGGKDHASPRYIFTRLAPLARAIFPEHDDALLKHLYDDGQRIEPEHYLPVLPLLLVNGADGIGTGWSTSVPNYSPRDVVANLRRMLDGEPPAPMQPWYRGFRGTIAPAPLARAGDARGYLVSGTVRVLDDTTIEVTELPLGTWTQDYKEFLETLLKPEKKEEAPLISDYREHHTDVSVRFVITLPQQSLADAIAAGLEKKLKLTGKISTSNMHAFGPGGAVTRYDGPEDVLRAFFAPRLDGYARRREALLAGAGADRVRLDNKARFVAAVVDGSLVLARRARADLDAQLLADGYAQLPPTGGRGGGRAAGAGGDDDGDEADGGAASAASGHGAAAAPAARPAPAASFDYLLSLPLLSLTREKVAELGAARAAAEREVERLRATTPSALWRADLDAFLIAYEEAEAEAAREAAQLARQQAASRGGKAKAKAAAAGRMTVDESDDDDDDIGGDDSDSDGGAAAKRKAAAAKKRTAAAKKAAGGGGAAAPPPAAVPSCAAAELYAAACARAAAAHAAAVAAPPKPARAPRADGGAAGDDAADGDAPAAGAGAAGGGGAAKRPAPKKAAAKPRAAAAGGGGKRAAAPPAGCSDDDGGSAGDGGGDSDDGLGASLAERLAARGGAVAGGLAGGCGGAAAAAAPPAAPRAAAPRRAAAAPKPKPARGRLVSSDDDDDDDGNDDGDSNASSGGDDDEPGDGGEWVGSDDDDDGAAAAPAPARPKPAAAARKPAAAPKKPAAAAKPRAAAAKAKAAVVVLSDNDGGGDDDDAAAPAPARRPAAAKAAAKAAPAPKPAAAGGGKKRVLAKKPAASPAARARGGGAAASDGPTPAPKKSRHKAAPAAGRRAAGSDDDDDDAMGEAQPAAAASKPAAAAAAPRPGRAAAARKVYTISDSDEEGVAGGGGSDFVVEDDD